MNVKKLVFVMVCLMASASFASVYPLASGNWADATNWSKGVVPPDDGDEIKLVGSQSDDTGQDFVITVNSNVGNYSTTKIDTARGSTLLVVDGGYIGDGREMHIGDAGASGNGSDDGFLTQTGGTVDITGSGKLQIGYKAHSVDNPITGAKGGTYTISGGTLTGSAGRMYIACSSADGSIGKFKVVGTGGTITLGGTMYVANDSETGSGNTGDATIEFVLTTAGTVSKMQVAKTVIDSQDESAAVATLLVDATNGVPTDDILLIENTGTSAVVGQFDTVNGVEALEGALVDVGGVTMTLTYQYVGGEDGEANDIALIIPEPATLALLGLGLLAIRRKK